jgi:SAM-dependent methyltransferase
MTTLPPEPAQAGPPAPAPTPAATLAAAARQRRVAESFGTDAGRYDRARPSYPAAMADRIVAGSPGRDVVDAGCGTGISARLFQAAGCRVLGVDPDPRMADLARENGLDVEVAKFEEWDAAGRTFDAVIAGQAWHWVDMAAGAAKAAAVLRPGGRLAVFWNAFDPPAVLRQAFGAVYQRVVPDSPMAAGFWSRPASVQYLAMCETAADGMRRAGAFGDPQTWRFDWSRPYTRAEWLDQVPTFGGFSLLPPDVQAELLDGIGAAVDAVDGAFTMDYATLVATAAREAPTGETMLRSLSDPLRGFAAERGRSDGARWRAGGRRLSRAGSGGALAGHR